MRRISQQDWDNEHMHNPMTEGEALAVLDVDAIASSLVDWMLTKAMPNGDLLHASVACDYAGMANFKRALSKQLRAALREQPEARGVVDEDRALAEAFREIAKCSHAQDGVAGELFQAVRNKAALIAAQQPVQEGGGCMRDPTGADGQACPDATGTLLCCTAPPSAPVGVEVAVARLAFNEYPRWWVGLKAGQRKLFGREPARWAEEAFKAGARAALTQQPAQAATGWKLVPLEPTDGMLTAYYEADRRRAPCTSGWRAMLAAAPTPPGDDAAGERRDDLDDQDDADLEAWLGDRS